MTALLAHAGWGGEPLALAGLSVTAALLLLGRSRLGPRARRARRGRDVLLAAGLLAGAVAVGSPLNGAGEEQLAAHMAQHLLLMAVAAPLIVAGAPGLLLLHALPRRWRPPAGRLRLLGHRTVLAVGAACAAIWLAHTAALTGWHVPAVYDAALRSPVLHATQHVTMLVAALALWAVVLPRNAARGIGHGAAVLLLFASLLPGGLLAVVLLFATEPLYGAHGDLADQQLAGVLMWVPGAIPYALAAVALVLAELRRGELAARAREGLARGGPTTAMVALLVVLIGGCGGEDLRSPPPQMSEGVPERGRDLMADYGCNTCHMIPGVRDADATVGPPLAGWSQRGFIAGRLANSPENLIRWVRDPQDVDPENAMPDMGVTEADATDIAAYLFTLQDP